MSAYDQIAVTASQVGWTEDTILCFFFWTTLLLGISLDVVTSRIVSMVVRIVRHFKKNKPN